MAYMVDSVFVNNVFIRKFACARTANGLSSSYAGHRLKKNTTKTCMSDRKARAARSWMAKKSALTILQHRYSIDQTFLLPLSSK